MTNWLLFLGAALLASLLYGRSKPSWIWVVAAVLVAVAGKAFADTGIGGFTSSTLIGGLLGWFGSPEAGATILVLFMLGIVVFDVITDRKLDKRGAVALFLIPLLLLLTGGPLASGLNSAYDGLKNGVVTAISSI